MSEEVKPKKTVEQLYEERFIQGWRACAPLLNITLEQAEAEARAILAKNPTEGRGR